METNRRFIRTVSFLAFLFIPIPLLPSGGSLRAVTYFDSGSPTLKSVLHDNTKELSSICSVEKQASCHPQHIHIISGSSIDENPLPNERLSWQRAIQIRSYLQERFSFSNSLFVFPIRGEDLDGLYRLVMDSAPPVATRFLPSRVASWKKRTVMTWRKKSLKVSS